MLILLIIIMYEFLLTSRDWIIIFLYDFINILKGSLGCNRQCPRQTIHPKENVLQMSCVITYDKKAASTSEKKRLFLSLKYQKFTWKRERILMSLSFSKLFIDPKTDLNCPVRDNGLWMLQFLPKINNISYESWHLR